MLFSRKFIKDERRHAKYLQSVDFTNTDLYSFKATFKVY